MEPVADFEQALKRAASWADRLHSDRGHVYAEGLPYIEHLRAVEGVLVEFGYGDPGDVVGQNLRIASYSHDLVEDCGVGLSTIRVLQGVYVANLVDGVTLEGDGTREERFARTYPKTVRIPYAVVLKVADRIVNQRFSPLGSKHSNKYFAEYPGFRAALHGPHLDDARLVAMWAHLDALYANGTAKGAASGGAVAREAVGCLPKAEESPDGAWIT